MFKSFKKILLIITFIFVGFSQVLYGASLSYKEIKDAYHRSFMYEKSKDYRDAIKALMSVYKVYSAGYTVNLRLGWLYYNLGKYRNSETHYKKAIKVMPYSIEAKLGLSLPLMAQKQWKDVESLMNSVLKVDYYSYYGNLRLAYSLRNQKKYDLAEKVSRKMLAVYPANVSFLTELALDLFLQGKKKEAYKLFGNVLILDPENPTAKYYLGIK